MLPVIHIGPFPFYTFGIVFGLAICAGAYAFGRYFQRHNLPVNLPALCITLIVAGLLGAKLDNPHLLFAVGGGHFFAAVREQFLHGGYTYLGCVIAGVAAGTVYARVNHHPWLKSFDSMFCMGLGYAIGRIGCFLSGDGDYGIPSSLPWAVSFPHGTVPTLARVHPTMLYTTLYELLVFAMLWKLSSPRRRSPLPPGSILGLYLLLTSTGRFFVEFLSRNPRVAFGLTEAQIVSLVLACAGAGILAAVTRNRRLEILHPQAARGDHTPLRFVSTVVHLPSLHGPHAGKN